MAFLARLGAPVRGFLEFLGDQAHLVLRTLRHALLLRLDQLAVVGGQMKLQIRFTGLDALWLVSGTALLLGAVTLIQAFSQLSGLGAENYIGALMVLIILRELGPLLTAVLVIGRSATAIAAELGAMQLNGEVDALAAHGVNPYQYLLLPRWLGVLVSVFALVVFFDAMALGGGFLVAKLKYGVTFGFYMDSVRQALSNRDFTATLLKVALFSGAITFHACHFGLRIQHSQTEIPQAVTKTVVSALVAVFALDGLIAALLYF
ncbi:MAG: ABC transporter permease [Holophagaceae bacterium]|uniref:ABC transporter permease n=1 Tax=Candidatus Geothrix odensensis TaxID=2954440 RepID=A0A936F4T4_9BACT|nr:ABC transporter permease [Holophagaceae bacterium]MBK8573908.1 ABC transporter permease [Candidatus Geothrix odensensis]MBK8789203.1 ABC transporter permease [Holophagaceae bacterium]